MNSFLLLIAVLLISSGYFFLATRSSKAVRTAGAHLHSLPHYYGLFAGLVAALPALVDQVIASGGPAVIDVPVSDKVVSPVIQRSHG